MIGISASIIALASAGVLSAFTESLCEKMNKPDYAQFIKITGWGLAGTTVAVTVGKFLKTLSQF